LALGDREGALCLDSRLGLLAVIRERLRQAQAGAEVLRVDRQRASDEALALRGVTAERPRDVQQQRALAEERGRELRREGERAIHRLADRSQLEQARQARPGDPRLLAERTETGEVGARVLVVGGDGLCGERA